MYRLPRVRWVHMVVVDNMLTNENHEDAIPADSTESSSSFIGTAVKGASNSNLGTSTRVPGKYPDFFRVFTGTAVYTWVLKYFKLQVCIFSCRGRHSIFWD